MFPNVYALVHLPKPKKKLSDILFFLHHTKAVDLYSKPHDLITFINSFSFGRVTHINKIHTNMHTYQTKGTKVHVVDAAKGKQAGRQAGRQAG